MSDPGPEPSDKPLEFPDDAPPVRMPPRMPLDRWLERVAEVRAWFPGSIPTPEERLRSRVDVPFRL